MAIEQNRLNEQRPLLRLSISRVGKTQRSLQIICNRPNTICILLSVVIRTRKPCTSLKSDIEQTHEIPYLPREITSDITTGDPRHHLTISLVFKITSERKVQIESHPTSGSPRRISRTVPPPIRRNNFAP